jgi:hypothetical protein
MLGRQPTEPIPLLLAVLAAWRLTALIVYESGPFRLFERVRKMLVRIGLGRLVGCFHCLGLWIAGAVTLLVFDPGWASLLVWLGLAGAISVIERWLGGEIGGAGDGV